MVSEPSPPGGDSSLPPPTLSAISAASRFGDPITLLMIGTPSDPAVEPSALPGEVSSVVKADIEGGEHAHLLPENVALAIKVAIEAGDGGGEGYARVVAAHTKFGSSYMPRIGAMLDVAPVPDVVEILDDETFVRPIYAGNALAKVKSTDSPLKMLSIRPTAFDKVELGGSSASITKLEMPSQGETEWLGESVTKSDRPDLGSARTVVSGGRGMKSGDNFVLLEKLADKLGGAVGASRAAVDAGFVPNNMQVGQTGKVVAPDLYIAVGISGAIQHLSGMKDSKTIVAINKDAEAPIFQVADYGLVADLFDAVPEMTEKV